MSKLNQITVKGYKSIEILEDFPLDNLNVLIGSNGAGKSNFISLFRLMHETYYGDLNLYVNKQGGVDSFLHFGRGHTENLLIELSFADINLSLKYMATNDNRLSCYDTEATSPYNNGLTDSLESFEKSIQKNVLSCKIYHFHDTSDHAKVKRQHPIIDNLVLKSDAENLAPYLYMLREKYFPEYDRIVNTIKLVLPYFHDFVQRKDVEYVELEWLQKNRIDTPLKAHMLSDGSLRFICLMTLLLQPEELLPDTILIDEPELGLHPYAIAILADVIKQVSENKQLIISTQSVELLNHFDCQNVIVVNQVDEKSQFKRLDPVELENWLEDYTLGELWQSNLFGGRP